MKIKLPLFAYIALIVLGLAACNSMHVTVSVQRPPNMDTSGIRRISIMPFEVYQNNALQNEIARSLTTTATSRIAETRQFTLVDSSEIQRLQRANQSIEGHVDAILTGQIITINVNDTSRQATRYNAATRTNVQVTLYERTVELSFSYSLVRARDGSIIGTVTRRGTNSDSNENRNNLRTASTLAQSIVTSRLANIAQDLAPYRVNERRTLLEDRSDRNLRTSMENAFAQVRAQNYRAAINMYLQIYSAYHNFPSLYNAALLHEVIGEPETAVDMFQRLYADTGNPRALDEIQRLNRLMEEQGMIAAHYGDESQTPRDRVVALALEEVQRVLTSSDRVWIYNSSRSEIDLTNGVILDISAALMRDGVIVVDRDTASIRAAEMELQMRGSVRDEDIVSIGNAAGASVIVDVSIQGTGHLRRLQIRVIDIARGIPIMTSDTGERWGI